MEIEIIKTLQSVSSPALDVFCKVISYLGSYLGFIFILIVLFVFYKKSFAISFGITYGISVGINYLIKHLVARPRPYMVDSTIVNKLSAVGLSFPSGHTLSATIICFFLAVWIFDKVKTKWLKALLLSLCIIFIALVMFSRMYLGQHYLTDTVGGFAFGVIYSLVGYFTYTRIKRRLKNDKQNN